VFDASAVLGRRWSRARVHLRSLTAIDPTATGGALTRREPTLLLARDPFEPVVRTFVRDVLRDGRRAPTSLVTDGWIFSTTASERKAIRSWMRSHDEPLCALCEQLAPCAAALYGAEWCELHGHALHLGGERVRDPYAWAARLCAGAGPDAEFFLPNGPDPDGHLAGDDEPASDADLAALGLRAGATPEDVRRAHRALVLEHHPDRATSDADREARTKRTAAVNAARARILKA
jgi:DnaJ-domain-containing protein 1